MKPLVKGGARPNHDVGRRPQPPQSFIGASAGAKGGWCIVTYHNQEAAPLSLNVNSHFGWALLFARRTDEAIDKLRRTLDIDPNFPNAHLYLGMGYEQQGRHNEALDEIQKARDLSGGNLLMVGSLGHAYGTAGHRAEAGQVLAEMTELGKQRYLAALDFAYVYSGLKGKEKTFEWLEKAYQERSGWLIWIDADPRLDWLRSDPRFESLLRRLHLRTEPRA